MTKERVGVLGASGLLGASLLPLLIQRQWQVTAYSRRATDSIEVGIEWCRLDTNVNSIAPEVDSRIASWICLVPIWILPHYFPLLSAHGVRRVVALSSTSRFTKLRSSDPQEQAIVHWLSEGERRLIQWADNNDVEWVILRPTLIYGRGRDKNVAEIARFIRRFRFFPLLGRATGLRQPVHAEDVAAACTTALEMGKGRCAYNLSGGETLSYRDMVSRIFLALGRRPRLVTIPLWCFRLAISYVRLIPRYRRWSAAMAERMNQDLVFDHEDAKRDLDFSPRLFRPNGEEVQPIKLVRRE